MGQQEMQVALVSLLGIAIGAALQYAFGRSLESRKQHGLQKAQAYTDFFHAVAALAQARSADQLMLAADAKTRICIYGSDAVISKLDEFERAGATAGTDTGRAALVKLMQVMREDVINRRTSVELESLYRILFGSDPSAS